MENMVVDFIGSKNTETKKYLKFDLRHMLILWFNKFQKSLTFCNLAVFQLTRPAKKPREHPYNSRSRLWVIVCDVRDFFAVFCFIVNIMMSGRAHLLHLETKKEIRPINRHNVIKNLSHCLPADFFVTNEKNFDLERTIFSHFMLFLSAWFHREFKILKYINFTVSL